jgi:mono/diheme cytochrome c family protein
MRRIFAVLLLLALVGAGLFWFLTSPDRQNPGLEPVATGAPDLTNGAVVYHAGGCAACHATPKQEDRNRLGGGVQLASPFGTFSVPNISPHPRDGIGAWTLGQFQRALRAGVAPDGRHYYPAFPYQSYQRLTAADIRDLFGHLKMLPPVEGRAPDHQLSFPYNLRRGMGLWKLAFLDGEAFRPDSGKSAEWNRGAYLVEAAAHCAECHSPRDFTGAIPEDRRFAGGPNPVGRGTIPNITPHETGLKDWSKADVIEVLTSGLTPLGDSVGGEMAQVVRDKSQLPQADRAAIAEYILSLPPRPGPKRPE